MSSLIWINVIYTSMAFFSKGSGILSVVLWVRVQQNSIGLEYVLFIIKSKFCPADDNNFSLILFCFTGTWLLLLMICWPQSSPTSPRPCEPSGEACTSSHYHQLQHNPTSILSMFLLNLTQQQLYPVSDPQTFSYYYPSSDPFFKGIKLEL